MGVRDFSVAARIRSVRHALRGVLTMLASQHNAWIHALATAAVCVLGVWLDLSRLEWCWVVVAIVAVWTAEALNTAFELLCDAAAPEFHPLVKRAKDVAAGAVLISAIGAVVLAILILGPHLAQRLAV